MSMTKGTPASSQIVWLEGRVKELEAEVKRLRAALEAWNNAVRVHVMMEKPVFIGVSPTLGRLAWEKARAALEEK